MFVPLRNPLFPSFIPPCCIVLHSLSEQNKNVELGHNDTCGDVKYGLVANDWPVLYLKNCRLAAVWLFEGSYSINIIYVCPRCSYLRVECNWTTLTWCFSEQNLFLWFHGCCYQPCHLPFTRLKPLFSLSLSAGRSCSWTMLQDKSNTKCTQYTCTIDIKLFGEMVHWGEIAACIKVLFCTELTHLYRSIVQHLFCCFYKIAEGEWTFELG